MHMLDEASVWYVSFYVPVTQPSVARKREREKVTLLGINFQNGGSWAQRCRVCQKSCGISTEFFTAGSVLFAQLAVCL